MICPRTDIQDLFNTLSEGNDYLSNARMIKFLNETQKDPKLNEIFYLYSNRNIVQYIIDTYELNTLRRCQGEISVDSSDVDPCQFTFENF